MCITASVGKGGLNRPQDVRIIQALLNMCRWHIGIASPWAMDGKIGRKTIAAIGAFQRAVSGATQPDCRVDCGGITLGLLRQCMPQRFTREKLQGIMAAASEALVASYFNVLTRAMA
ncbi:MAG: peptidoglycan-binding domain-containing protein, partial [Candidatus Acidiferrales bacterium]